MRRLTRREQLREKIANLDTFPKVVPEYAQDVLTHSSSGGIATIVTIAIILLLVGSEIVYYRTVDVKYKYKVDHDMRKDMNMTIDITIPMLCSFLGADYIDVAGKSTDATLFLKMEHAHFKLAPNQIEWMKANSRLKDGEGSHGLDSLNRFLDQSARRERMPAPAPNWDSPPDSCRIYGIVPVSKISGNFHITAGKSVHHSRGHAHLVGSVPITSINFTHRIDRLSFAEGDFGAQTLDGETKTTDIRFAMFQYFLDIVPTTARPLGNTLGFRSNQYSVTEQTKDLGDLTAAIPGIYFRYDLEAISVEVYEERRSMLQFLIRLCGIIGGIFATSGVLHTLLTGALGTFQKKPAVLPTN